MPKQIDVVERKNQIAAATWRVILDRGIDKASIQNIANEADMSVGLIQHHFSSKEKIMHYAMQLVIDRMEERAYERTQAFKGTKEESLRRRIKFLIPVNEEELIEARVWISFLGRSFSNSELSNLQKKLDEYSRKMMQMIVNMMMDLGYLKENDLIPLESEMLYAFIDGLVIHTIQAPELYTEEKINQLIEYYLKQKREKSYG